MRGYAEKEKYTLPKKGHLSENVNITGDEDKAPFKLADHKIYKAVLLSGAFVYFHESTNILSTLNENVFKIVYLMRS